MAVLTAYQKLPVPENLGRPRLPGSRPRAIGVLFCPPSAPAPRSQTRERPVPARRHTWQPTWGRTRPGPSAPLDLQRDSKQVPGLVAQVCWDKG